MRVSPDSSIQMFTIRLETNWPRANDVEHKRIFDLKGACTRTILIKLAHNLKYIEICMSSTCLKLQSLILKIWKLNTIPFWRQLNKILENNLKDWIRSNLDHPAVWKCVQYFNIRFFNYRFCSQKIFPL